MLLNDAIESVSKEPSDDVSDDNIPDLTEIGLSAPRDLTICGKIEVFWPITATKIVPDNDQATEKHGIDYDKGDHETPLRANRFDVSITLTIHSESLKMYHETFDQEESYSLHLQVFHPIQDRMHTIMNSQNS